MLIDHTEDGQVRITVPVNAIQTKQAEDIVGRILPSFVLMFLEKNRKYRNVDNSLGSKGIVPDLNRKLGIIIDRVWDGNDSPGESTREVCMDMIGHLLLMIHMMDDEKDTTAGMRLAEYKSEAKRDAIANLAATARDYMLGQAGERVVGRSMPTFAGTTMFDPQAEADRGVRDDGPNYGLDDDDADDEPLRPIVDIRLPGDNEPLRLPRPLHLDVDDSEKRRSDHKPGRGGW